MLFAGAVSTVGHCDISNLQLPSSCEAPASYFNAPCRIFVAVP